MNEKNCSIKTRRPNTRPCWVSIVGARPQFVKLAPFCRAVEKRNSLSAAQKIDHQIIHTGQHYDKEIAGVFFDQMNIPVPKYNLGVGSGSHGVQLARMLARMEPILSALRPDWVIVYGDTNSTLAGALLAARLQLPLAHVEAGCRSAQLHQPEEQNRITADHLSQLLLPASTRDLANLHREGIASPDDPFRRRAVVVGDILLDALLQNSSLSGEDATEHLSYLGLQSKQYYLLTIHRAENTDDPARLRGIFEAVTSLDLPVLFPMHPRTRQILIRQGISLNGNVTTVAPQGYREMQVLLCHARKILTDSGGLQKEAFYLGVPCVTLRERTEWVETIEARANCLAGAEPQDILAAVRQQAPASWAQHRPYGDGNAAHKIVAELEAAIPAMTEDRVPAVNNHKRHAVTWAGDTRNLGCPQE